jgi:hypothetical protein
MDIGTGISIADIWLLPLGCVLSNKITSTGIWIAIIIAITMTFVLK